MNPKAKKVQTFYRSANHISEAKPQKGTKKTCGTFNFSERIFLASV
jgi:hypothetical protein